MATDRRYRRAWNARNPIENELNKRMIDAIREIRGQCPLYATDDKATPENSRPASFEMPGGKRYRLFGCG